MKFIVYVHKHAQPMLFIADDVVDTRALLVHDGWQMHVLESDEVNVVTDHKDVIKVMIEENK